MRKSRLTRWLTRLAWAVVGVDVASIFFAPPVSDDNLLLQIVYLLGITLSLATASTWLVIRYRKIFSTWPGWAATVLVYILSNVVVQNVLPVSNPLLADLFVILFIAGGWAFIISTILLLLRRDVGLQVAAWGGAIIIWTYVFAWRFQGNLIELELMTMTHPNDRSPLWWLHQLMCIFGALFPLGAISFVWHTFRLILREFRGSKNS